MESDFQNVAKQSSPSGNFLIIKGTLGLHNGNNIWPLGIKLEQSLLYGWEN